MDHLAVLLAMAQIEPMVELILERSLEALGECMVVLWWRQQSQHEPPKLLHGAHERERERERTTSRREPAGVWSTTSD